MNICPLCKRPYGGEMEVHHLKPVTFRTRTKQVHDLSNQVTLHRICHSAIHAFFKEKELFHRLYTIELLLEQPDIINFVNWVKTKDPDFYMRVRRSNRRKK